MCEREKEWAGNKTCSLIVLLTPKHIQAAWGDKGSENKNSILLGEGQLSSIDLWTVVSERGGDEK